MKIAIIVAFVIIVFLLWRTEFQKQKTNKLAFLLFRTLDEMEKMKEKINELEERNK